MIEGDIVPLYHTHTTLNDVKKKSLKSFNLMLIVFYRKVTL